jgi:hypothetical protein
VDLHGLVDLLPTANQRLLKRIVYTLRKVSQHSAQNKMNEDNLGMIFGPNLLRALAGNARRTHRTHRTHRTRRTRRTRTQ